MPAIQSPSPKILPHLQAQINAQPDHPLKNFAIIFTQPVAWGDMDAFNHVNNVQYYEYSQSARVHYMREMALFDKSLVTVLAASSCQYLRPVTFPDTLYIGVRIKKLGNTSITSEYHFFSQEQQMLVAKGEAVVVLFEADGKTKRQLSPANRQKIIDMEASVGYQVIV